MQLACAKVGSNSNLIVAVVIRDVVMTCTYTAQHKAYGMARRGAGLTLTHRAHGHINTSSLVAPLSRQLTRQENRGMQVRSRDASLTRPFLPCEGCGLRDYIPFMHKSLQNYNDFVWTVTRLNRDMNNS